MLCTRYKYIYIIYLIIFQDQHQQKSHTTNNKISENWIITGLNKTIPGKIDNSFWGGMSLVATDC